MQCPKISPNKLNKKKVAEIICNELIYRNYVMCFSSINLKEMSYERINSLKTFINFWLKLFIFHLTVKSVGTKIPENETLCKKVLPIFLWDLRFLDIAKYLLFPRWRRNRGYQPRNVTFTLTLTSPTRQKIVAFSKCIVRPKMCNISIHQVENFQHALCQISIRPMYCCVIKIEISSLISM